MDLRGVIGCLVRSLKASKRGWRIPEAVTLLGPVRIWKAAITLRSKSVKKATLKRIKRHIKNEDKIWLKII